MHSRRASGRSDWQLYRRLLTYVLPWWHYFAFSLIGYTIYSLGNVLLADMMQFLLDALGETRQVASGIISGFIYHYFGAAGLTGVELARIAVPLAILLLTFTRAMGFFVGSYFMNHVARNLIHRLRCELFEKMLVAPSDYYESHSQGELIAKIIFNVDQVTGATTKALKIIVRETLTVVALLTYMMYLNWRLCLVFIAVVPFIALVVKVVGKHFRRYSRRIQATMGNVTQVSNETIGAYREVRVFAGQAQQLSRFQQASDDNRIQNLKLAFADALSTPVIQTLLAVALAVLVWFALSPAVLSGFSAGSLVAFLTAAGQLGKPIRQLSGVQSVLQRGLAAAEDIFQQLDGESEPDEGTLCVERAAGNIRIEGLSFTYPGADTPALDNICFNIEAGRTVALVGRSGSGKSTLVQLIARFHVPDDGGIFLDGVAIEQYQLANLRAQIAMVSQDVPLFRDTVYNNIAYGALADCAREDVFDAARSAHASDFIEQLPKGFDTLLGDDGSGLSGGQRQRIAMARAFLKNAPLLVLDEATSALDYESEHHIQQALDSIMTDRTTIVIAHRLSTVERADCIVVMDAGQIVATGTHQQLLAEGGLYAQLYARKFSD